MRIMFRTVIVIALIWNGLLLSGYGVLVGSYVNAAGLGVKCSYLTARDIITSQFVHVDRGIISLPACPVLRKNEIVINSAQE